MFAFVCIVMSCFPAKFKAFVLGKSLLTVGMDSGVACVCCDFVIKIISCGGSLGSYKHIVTWRTGLEKN